MAMNGIGQFDLYDQYKFNRIGEQEIPRVAETTEAPAKQEESVVAGEKEEVSLSLNLDDIRARHNMELSDISLSMSQPSGSSFEMKALSYTPEKDEIDKAVSDMQKDAALMKYSVFVGESNVIMDNEDGVVLRKMSQE
ncbi:MAG: hypothetical protein J5518_06670 [Lachnospiraceae bacterium]|nr:hypothetical protein [Lachnospiraceae bacterium]